MGQGILKTIHAGIYGVNCYLLMNPSNGKALVVDPGGDAEKILKQLSADGFEPAAILLTHGHGDHILGVRDLKALVPGLPVYAGEGERAMLEDPQANRFLGVKDYLVGDVNYLEDRSKIEPAGFSVTVYFTPGHSPGSVCYYVPEEKILFSGDTMFHGSYGRTDLPGGSDEQMRESLIFLAEHFEDDVRVLPGHMSETTIGYEKRWNPGL